VDAAPTPRGARGASRFSSLPGGGNADASATAGAVDGAGSDFSDMDAPEEAQDGEEGGATAGFASAWVVKVSLGAAGAYAAALLSIRALTSRGTRQLEADADYFCNVLAALSLPPPPALATLRCLCAPLEEGVSRGAAAAAAARAGEFEWDAAAADALARMRAAGDALEGGGAAAAAQSGGA
jgi:hypothetical protein